MSRTASAPVTVPKGVEFKLEDGLFTVKGSKGTLTLVQPDGVEPKLDEGAFTMVAESPQKQALAGTIRSLLSNMIIGVTEGFERKLNLVGVGFRASMQGNDLSLALGFSHPVVFTPPEGITIEVPSQTEIVVKGADKQLVGQVAAKIRGFRPPEPYKGKGVRYANERVNLKEAKKA